MTSPELAKAPHSLDRRTLASAVFKARSRGGAGWRGDSLGLLGNVGWWDRAPPAGYLREYAPAAPKVSLPREATVGLWGGGKQDGVTADSKTSQPGLRDQQKSVQNPRSELLTITTPQRECPSSSGHSPQLQLGDQS